jgi:hypothetical protein
MVESPIPKQDQHRGTGDVNISLIIHTMYPRAHSLLFTIALALPFAHEASSEAFQHINQHSILGQVEFLHIIPSQDVHSSDLTREDGVIERHKDSILSSYEMRAKRRERSESEREKCSGGGRCGSHAKPPQNPLRSESGMEGICERVVVVNSMISIPAASKMFISTRATSPCPLCPLEGSWSALQGTKYKYFPAIETEQ